MMEIILPASIVGGLGLIFGIGLSFASKKFAVEVDERVAMVREVLPGANCAACGQTGCDSFAEAVVEGTCAPNGCPVGGAEAAQKISEIMGVEAGDMEVKTARVLCGGTTNTCKSKYSYEGIDDCAAAASLYGGPQACSYGCVGLGNCVKACPFGAIVVQDGLAKVIQSKCTGCGKCVAACPKKIIELVDVSKEYTVQCSSLDRGNIVRQNCSVGCIGCGKCARVCSEGAIKLNNMLAKVDYKLCKNCGECAKACPTKAINVFVCPELHTQSSPEAV
jgi:electron transport complex protein RnfB